MSLSLHRSAWRALKFAIRGTLAGLCLAAGLARAGDPIAAGDIRGETGRYGVVFYYTPDPLVAPLDTARELAARLLPDVRFWAEPGMPPKPPYISFEGERAPMKKLTVPPASHLQHAGRGMTEPEIVAIQETTRATRLVLVVPRENVWWLGRKFTELALEFAERTEAFIMDDDTRECFGRAAWKTERLGHWPRSAFPDVTRQITIHLYQPDPSAAYLRVVTLGMEKFALPDLVIERLTGGESRAAGNLVNMVCQLLAEQPIRRSGVEETFRLDSLQATGLRTNLEAKLEKDATKAITLALLQGIPREGDPDNRLVELGFRYGAGKTENERRRDSLSKLWGTQDAAVGVTHTPEILQASKRARARLPSLRAAFGDGLPAGSRLLVKAPFARDDAGNEWMWVEVMSWPSDDELKGVLQNDPLYIHLLKAGAAVSVSSTNIFDYLLYREDGTVEGNETGKLMEKQAWAASEEVS